MTRLLGLIKFELKQFALEKANIFWTFAFPVLFLFFMNNFYTSLLKEFRFYPDIQVSICGDSRESYSLFSALKSNYGGALEYHFAKEAHMPEVDFEINLSSQCSNNTSGYKTVGVISRVENEDLDKWLINVLYAWIQRDHKNTINFTHADKNTQSNVEIALLFPGITTMTLLSVCLYGVVFALVTMRRMNVFKKYQLFPVNRYQLISVFVLSRAIYMFVFSIFFISLLLVLSPSLLHSTNYIALISVVTLGVFTFLALGILISNFFISPAAAAGVVNILYMFLTVASALFIPESVFPNLLNQIMDYLPVKAFSDQFRLVLFGHSSINTALHNYSVLGVWLLGATLLSIKTFRWCV